MCVTGFSRFRSHDLNSLCNRADLQLNTQQSRNAEPLLVHRLRRWPNIVLTLAEHLVFDGYEPFTQC